jgi:hypothetical protein
MRLSDFRKKAPSKESIAPKVQAVVEQALVALGADTDPECWVAWGDDPSIRYLLFAPTPGGLVQVNVRVAVPGEGPRAAGKVIRWSRVQLGELGVEIQGGHRLVTFQVESQVLNGADASADAISAFAQTLLAASDGRTISAVSPARKRYAGRAAAGPRATTKRAATSAAKSASKPAAKSADKPVPRLSAPRGATS